MSMNLIPSPHSHPSALLPPTPSSPSAHTHITLMVKLFVYTCSHTSSNNTDLFGRENAKTQSFYSKTTKSWLLKDNLPSQPGKYMHSTGTNQTVRFTFLAKLNLQRSVHNGRTELNNCRIEGFQPEWYITTIHHCRDIPFWLEALGIISIQNSKLNNKICFYIDLACQKYDGQTEPFENPHL